MPKLFYVGVKGLIEDEQGRILVLLADVSTHRKNTEPYWDIPGGRIEEGDDVAATLKREISEETGITEVASTELLTAVVSNHEIPIDAEKTAGLILMVYKVTIPANSTVVISEEHQKYEWVSKAEAAERLEHKYPAEFTSAL